MEKIKLFDSFSGVGALHSALKRLGVKVELVGISEVDPDAIINYAAIHIDEKELEEVNRISNLDDMRKWLMDRNIGWDFTKQKSSIPRMKKDKLEKLYNASVKCNNLGDISKLKYEDMPDFDIFNFSFPCTDVSTAGKQKGLKNEDGTHTRSGLVKFGLEVIKAKKPKYIMIENVKGLIQKKFINDFYSIVEGIEGIGYKCYYPTKEDKKGNKSPMCLNAKDFGVPQNRGRIFVICVREDIDTGYEFPKGFPLEIRLKDILEDSVDEKYFIGKTKDFFIKNSFDMERKGNGFRFEPHVRENASISKCITTRSGARMDDNFIMYGSKSDNEKFKFDTTNSELDCLNNNYKIRKLTPLECWRLMSFTDEEFEKAKLTGCSDSQLYKQAGNSIVVNVLYYILKNLIK